jgi:tetratricopeptide (TPR) repeat protein
MGHIAFELFTLIENIPLKIESLAVWGDTLFVGTSEGSLLIYNIIYSSGSDSGSFKDNKRQFTYTLSSSRKDFAKKPITQLCTVPELGILVSLSDGQIRLHTLSMIREIDTLKNAKGQNMKGIDDFALKKHRGQFSMVLTFTKKQMVIMEYSSKESTFKFVQELLLPDIAKSINWCGDNICVGYKREYSLIDPKSTNPPKKLFNTGVNQQTTLGRSLPKEIVVAINNIGITINFDGKPTRKHGIGWGEMPPCVGFLEPYLIAPVGMFVEIRILSNTGKNDTFIQTIPINGVLKVSQPNFIDYDEGILDHGLGVAFRTKTKLDPNDEIDPENRIFMCTKNGIYVLAMRQFFLQAQELQQKKEFEQALHLCDIVEGSKYEVEKWRVNAIHLEYGFHLFSKGEFDKAMEHFSKTEDDPRIIIALFPDLLPSSSKSFQQSVPLSPDEKIKVDKMLQDVEQRKNALNALIQFLSCRRVPVTKEISKQDLQIAEAVDTALLKALLYNNDDYVTKFLETPNRCIIADSERVLLQYKKYAELVLFYKTKGLHERALVLLRQLGEGSKSKDGSAYTDMLGVRQTIRYLQELRDNNALILEFSKWVLKKEPILGLKIFQTKDCPFDVKDVLAHLESIDGQKLTMSIAYLEHIIRVEKNMEPDLHNQLIILYLTFITHPESREVDPETKKPTFELDEIQKRLKLFLSESQHYNAERMLSKFPFDSLYEERAILLSRINRHSQALNIYVHKLKRPDLAEQYCVQHFDPSPNAPEESREIFITLLRMHLEPTDSQEQPRIDDAIRLLERHYTQIDLIKALRLLPSNMEAVKLSKFLESVLRCHVTKRRTLQINKNLSRSENLQVQEKYIKERKRVVKIKPDKKCQVCHRPLGLSAFACYPNGVLVHYVCTKNNVNVCPVTNRNFVKEEMLSPLAMDFREEL